MNVLVITPGQIPEAKNIGEGLAALQAVVGGPIQAIYPFEEPVALICHEEGKLLGLPLNRCLRQEDIGTRRNKRENWVYPCKHSRSEYPPSGTTDGKPSRGRGLYRSNERQKH